MATNMTNCPSCNAEVKQNADYCPNCGEALSVTCSRCGESVPKGAEFCPSCGSEIGVEEPDGNTWELEPDVLARRIGKGDMKSGSLLGWLTGRKKVVVKEGTKALVFKGGETIDEIGPGEYTVSSLTGRIKDRIKSSGFSLSDGDISVVLLKTTETTAEVGFNDLRTSGEFEVDVILETVFTVDDPEIFYREMVSGRSEVTVRELLDEMRGAVRNILEAKLKKHDHDELYGNPQLVDEMEQDVEHRCRRTLEANGLRLVRIQSFDYEGDLDDIRDKRREGRKEVLEREAELDTKEEKKDLDKTEREVEASDAIHQTEVEQDVKEVKHEASMKDDERGHEDEMQDIEHEHEEKKRAQDARHDVEEDEVVHEEEKKNIRTEEEVERRDTQFEQDKKEMEDLLDVKDKKDRQKMEKEMEKKEHEVEMEGEKLEQRDGVDLETLASLDGVDKDVSELAKMEKAGELTPEQLDSLGAQESDELAKARQEAKKAEKERQRVEDQKEMREEMKEMMDESADRVQETADKAMDSMGGAAEAAAEDTSDNVIVSGEGGSSGGDTTIVQGGGDGGGSDSDDGSDSGETKMIVCPECDEEQEYGSEFCISCGAELS